MHISLLEEPGIHPPLLRPTDPRVTRARGVTSDRCRFCGMASKIGTSHAHKKIIMQPQLNTKALEGKCKRTCLSLSPSLEEKLSDV
jgi:hypothetical protein